MKLNRIIKLSDAFSTEVNVLRDYSYRSPEGNEEKVRGYLPNKSSRDILKSILASCAESTDKKLHLIISSYGTGKSYLLLIIANLLANKKVESNFVDKIKDKESFYLDGLSKSLDNHLNNSSPLLIVIPEYGDSDFDHSLIEALKFALKNNDIDYIPKTNYEEAIKTINHWKEKSPHNYIQFNDNIKGTSLEKFLEQLKIYDQSTYVEFKSIYLEIIGNSFSESHTSAYPIYADTAKAIRQHGFRGIAIIYDEFGEMLGKLINSSSSATGLPIQQFIEDIKDKNDGTNILFISASHQDPQSLRASKGKDLNKIIGRFERHQLTVSEAEGEEIIGTIFIKEDPSEFEKIIANPLFNEHLRTIEDFNLYSSKGREWIETKVLRNLYPLHPLTAYILPRLSSEFAQNTRSMFNFLSPTETKEGAFRNYLDSFDAINDGNLNLFTPDLLLEFFIKNIREDKGGMIQAYHDAYRESLGKMQDKNQQSIIKNLFMLYVVKNALIQPNKDTLFWAMNWNESRREEFQNLLDDMTNTWELLELNPVNNNYQFPDFGSAPLSKVIDEELKKLDDFSFSDYVALWEDVHKPLNFPVRDHNNRLGCNREYVIKSVNDIGCLILHLKALEDYYHDKIEYFGNGYIFYLLGTSEDEIAELENTIKKQNSLLKYIITAIPSNLPQFENLMKDTLFYKAVLNTSKRPDVLQNPARLKNIEDQMQAAFTNLEEKVKTLYEPMNWRWNYMEEKDIELISKTKFSSWINLKTDLLYSDTPTIKDEALWFTAGNKGSTYRKQALRNIFNAEKDRIQLSDDSNSSADSRIVRAFFANSAMTVDKKRDKSIQYGEIKMPDEESQFYKAWKLIESKLKSGSYVHINEIINPMLQAPYGLSVNIIKFLLTSFIRYEIERVTISVNKTKVVVPLSVDLIDLLFSKPTEYVVRKIEISGPELRYLNHLKKLFDKQDTNTWVDVMNKFIGISQFLTPIQKSLIRISGDSCLIDFYTSIEDLKMELQINKSEKEKISKSYFQEILPSLLIDEDFKFIEDDTKVINLITKLDKYKKYPTENEAILKLEIIRELSDVVFGKIIVNKTELIQVVADWFKKLPAPNQSGKFENAIITSWLFEIKNCLTSDPFELYLSQLNEKPIKEWSDISYEKYGFIDRFKGYKKTVEEYTKSPIEVLQFFARSMFEKSAAECNSESAFDGFVRSWWETLPAINKNEQYSAAANLFINQLSIPSSVKTKYLEIIPQAWGSLNYLPAYVPKRWESWSSPDSTIVGEKYSLCIEEITNWRPPIALIEVVNRLGDLFDLNELTKLEELFDGVNDWYNRLPERTRNANWELSNHDIFILIEGLANHTKFELLITNDLPMSFKLAEFKLWDHNVLELFLTEFNILKSILDNYKRSSNELIAIIENNKGTNNMSEEGFCFNLINKIKGSEVYKNKINYEQLIDPIARIVYYTFIENSDKISFTDVVKSIADNLPINSDPNLWSDKDDKLFASAYKKGIDEIVKWKFPEVEKINNAKLKVKQGLLILQKELELNESQLRKVLNDIIENK